MNQGPAAILRIAGAVVILGGVLAGSAVVPHQIDLGPTAGTGPGTAASAGVGVATGATSTAVTEVSFSCPGPETESVSGVPAVPGEAVSVLVATAPDQTVAGIATAPGKGSVTIRAVPEADLGSTDKRGSRVVADLAGATVAQVTAVGPLAVGVSALQTGLRREGDERGLQATSCVGPRSDLWLLAGGGAASRRERLIVANPGSNPLTVDVAVHGASGPVASVNGSRIAVPPHGRVGVLIDALAPGEPSPAVHVTATGGQVTALLEDSWIDGATGRGRDNATAADGPATEQVIPAAFLTGTATLRVLVPGSEEAVVQSRAIGLDGAVPLASDGVVRIPGGQVRDIDLGGLTTGAYAVQVRSDRPVVAGLVLERRNGSQSDLAWAASTAAIPALAGTPVPPGTKAKVLLVGTASPWSATVDIVGSDGAVTSILAQGGPDVAWTADVPTAATAVWVRPAAGTVRAGLLAEAEDASGTLVTVVGLSPAVLTAQRLPLREVRR